MTGEQQKVAVVTVADSWFGVGRMPNTNTYDGSFKFALKEPPFPPDLNIVAYATLREMQNSGGLRLAYDGECFHLAVDGTDSQRIDLAVQLRRGTNGTLR